MTVLLLPAVEDDLFPHVLVSQLAASSGALKVGKFRQNFVSGNELSILLSNRNNTPSCLTI